MTPETEKIIRQAISDAIDKNIQLQKEEIFNEGFKEGIEKGEKQNKIEIAKKLKKFLTPEEISKITGLTPTTILNL